MARQAQCIDEKS